MSEEVDDATLHVVASGSASADEASASDAKAPVAIPAEDEVDALWSELETSFSPCQRACVVMDTFPDTGKLWGRCALCSTPSHPKWLDMFHLQSNAHLRWLSIWGAGCFGVSEEVDDATLHVAASASASVDEASASGDEAPVAIPAEDEVDARWSEVETSLSPCQRACVVMDTFPDTGKLWGRCALCSTPSHPEWLDMFHLQSNEHLRRLSNLSAGCLGVRGSR